MGAGYSKAIQPVSKFVFTNFEEEHHSTTGERLATDLQVSEFWALSGTDHPSGVSGIEHSSERVKDPERPAVGYFQVYKSKGLELLVCLWPRLDWALCGKESVCS